MIYKVLTEEGNELMKRKTSAVFTDKAHIALGLHCDNFNVDLTKCNIISVVIMNGYELSKMIDSITIIYNKDNTEQQTFKKISNE